MIAEGRYDGKPAAKRQSACGRAEGEKTAGMAVPWGSPGQRAWSRRSAVARFRPAPRGKDVETMKTAIIGAGRMGLRHLEVVRSMKLDLVGICDVSPDALRCAGERGAAETTHFADAATMLQQVKPECVIVATTAPSHADLTCLAAKRGARYIFCEKPIAVSLKEAHRMLATCREHGVRLGVNHQMRFMEQYTLPKRLVESESFGGLASITVVAGNFGFSMNGTHYVEMFRFMAGGPPVLAQAWFSEEKVPNPRGPQFEDRAGAMRLTTASGKRLFMDLGADQGHGVQVTYAGRYGRITVDELSGDLDLVVRKAEHRDAPTTAYGMPWERTTRKIRPADSAASTRSVLEAVLEGKDYPTGEDGCLAIAALVAAYVSHENGHTPVAVREEDLPCDRVFPWA